MKRGWKSLAAGAAALGLIAGLAATAPLASSKPASQAKSAVNVGIIYSRTGLLSAYGAEYVEGLRLGLAYATGGTGVVNGHKINFTFDDDGTDAAKAVSAAKDLIGKGYKIIAGTDSSGIALQLAPLAAQNQVLYISGPAASD